MHCVLTKKVEILFIALISLYAVSVFASETVQDIRVWNAPDSTRVVFDLSGPVEHRVIVLQNPDRVVVDIEKAVLKTVISADDLKDSPFDNIRTGVQNKTDLRVVFDLKKSLKPKSFLLKPNEQYKNDRLVLDFEDSSAEKKEEAIKTVEQIQHQKRDIIVAIDAGHGGEDPGALGAYKVREKDIVLKIAKQVRDLVDATPGFKAVMIRTGDYYVSLSGRRNLSIKNKADVFVSIHADAFTHSRAHGSSVYAVSTRGATSASARYLAKTENAADLIGGVDLTGVESMVRDVLVDLSMSKSMDASLNLGQRIVDNMGKFTHLHSKTVEQAAFAVLKQADRPSILVETGFVSNPEEARKLNTYNHRRLLAKAIHGGIVSYFNEFSPEGTLIAWQKKQGQGGVATAPMNTTATTTSSVIPFAGKYTVVKGDTLSDIASRHNVSVQALRQHNNLSSDVIYIGKVLKVPSNSSPVNTVRVHVISRGDTLSDIASRYNVSVSQLRSYNNLSNDTIWVGQKLNIPSL